MMPHAEPLSDSPSDGAGSASPPPRQLTLAEAETVLGAMADLHFLTEAASNSNADTSELRTPSRLATDEAVPILEARYRTLLEQISAIVFMAYLDRGIGEGYVSPQIEATLGFSQQEWLEDPIRWYQQIHPEDKQRWSLEAADMFHSGHPLRSVYRVLARDGHVVWFQCEARMVRRANGTPWFIQGVAFDVTDLKQAEASLQEERNVLSAILDTVGALVVVLDPLGRIARFNRACERTTGYAADEVTGRHVWDLFVIPDELDSFTATFAEIREGATPPDFETHWLTRNGAHRRIAWSSTILPDRSEAAEYIILTGIDITERRRLQKTVLDISAQEARRIGQDLHDGLGQHLTGIAFMSKVLERKLAESSAPESADADTILKLVNEAIDKTRELARGLRPVVSDAEGLMSALQRVATEVSDLFKISCQFDCDEPVLINDVGAATHLYHIAQEAVNNAIKHGNARHVLVTLSRIDDAGTLTIHDDGVGFPAVPASGSGMGLHIMRYRASMIGATLQVDSDDRGGTRVSCVFPSKTVSDPS
jgi:PAS domain S-box-containing protein